VEIENSGIATKVKLIEFVTMPFSLEERNRILSLCSPATSSVDEICYMNVYLGQKIATAALEVIKKSGKTTRDIDFISSHGQTIYHMPEKLATMQIGELAFIAAETGCLTVGDFRPSDMALGGQGAPLVPFVDYLLFRSNKKGRALINIGGISNVTILKANSSPEEIIAFDMGPGNMLIDAIVSIGTNGENTYDKDGEIAAKGKICREWLEKIFDNDGFIKKRPPKSTGREHYSALLAKFLWEEGISLGLNFEDIVATITAYTYNSIIAHFTDYIDKEYDIEEILIGGGGVYNNTLMNKLRLGLKQDVFLMEEFNFSSDAKEAIAFAILGNEFLHGNTNNLPSATGASRNVIMGKLALP
jgi:anhydro-N-acetylmuramic acid kinase